MGNRPGVRLPVVAVLAFHDSGLPLPHTTGVERGILPFPAHELHGQVARLTVGPDADDLDDSAPPVWRTSRSRYRVASLPTLLSTNVDASL